MPIRSSDLERSNLPIIECSVLIPTKYFLWATERSTVEEHRSGLQIEVYPNVRVGMLGTCVLGWAGRAVCVCIVW